MINRTKGFTIAGLFAAIMMVATTAGAAASQSDSGKAEEGSGRTAHMPNTETKAETAIPRAETKKEKRAEREKAKAKASGKE